MSCPVCTCVFCTTDRAYQRRWGYRPRLYDEDFEGYDWDDFNDDFQDPDPDPYGLDYYDDSADPYALQWDDFAVDESIEAWNVRKGQPNARRYANRKGKITPAKKPPRHRKKIKGRPEPLVLFVFLKSGT